MGDWPVREPWFLRGRRSRLQRAVLNSMALATLAMMATWAAIIICTAFFNVPNDWCSRSPGGAALVTGICVSLMMGFPIQWGLQSSVKSAILSTLGQLATLVIVNWCFWIAEPEILGYYWSRGVVLWVPFHAMTYATAFHAWLPTQVRGAPNANLNSKLAVLAAVICLSLVDNWTYPRRSGAWSVSLEVDRLAQLVVWWGGLNMAMLVPWGLPWWQAPPDEATSE